MARLIKHSFARHFLPDVVVWHSGCKRLMPLDAAKSKEEAKKKADDAAKKPPVDSKTVAPHVDNKVPDAKPEDKDARRIQGFPQKPRKRQKSRKRRTIRRPQTTRKHRLLLR